MNSIGPIFVLLFLVSCGKYATDKDLNKLGDRVDSLETQLAALENKSTANISAIESLNQSLEAVENAQENQGIAQNANYNSLLAMIQSLQEQTTTLLAKQAALELEDRVVGIYDPCPLVVSTGFQESLFRMSSGKLVAYFEQGNKRFLTVLKTGLRYRTTDSRACIFTL